MRINSSSGSPSSMSLSQNKLEEEFLNEFTAQDDD
jgi:hypothetical protein